MKGKVRASVDENGSPPPGFLSPLRSVELDVVYGPAEVANKNIGYPFEIVDAKAISQKNARAAGKQELEQTGEDQLVSFPLRRAC